jgi:hypothetical protein
VTPTLTPAEVLDAGRERPILFSAPMVRAILAGTKTQTRRIVKPRDVLNAGDPGDPAMLTRLARDYGSPIKSDQYGVSFDCDGLRGVVSVPMRCPYGEPGDRLWVREAWQPIWADGVERSPGYDEPEKWAVRFPATDSVIEYSHPDRGLTTACKPGIYLPRSLARITLEVTRVRVERLHDITEGDARSEGVEAMDGMFDEVELCRIAKLAGSSYEDARGWFAALWCQINGEDSWRANPWVWVVEFKRLEAAARLREAKR